MGRYQVNMGLKLRQAKLVNGIMTNSECWHGISMGQVKKLEQVDESLLRNLLQSHPKTPIEFLYLETGSVPVRHILSSRRINFLKTLLSRDDEEVTKRVLMEQLKNPCQGDFSQLVKEDLEKIGLTIDDVSKLSMKKLKSLVKEKIRNVAFKELSVLQESHKKVKNIKYGKLESQAYMNSNLFTNDEICLLAALRSRTVRGIKNNFKGIYDNDQACPLDCLSDGEVPPMDTQEHILVCKRLLQEGLSKTVTATRIRYNNIFEDIVCQKEAIVVFKTLIDARNKIIEDKPPVYSGPVDTLL